MLLCIGVSSVIDRCHNTEWTASIALNHSLKAKPRCIRIHLQQLCCCATRACQWRRQLTGVSVGYHPVTFVDIGQNSCRSVTYRQNSTSTMLNSSCNKSDATLSPCSRGMCSSRVTLILDSVTWCFISARTRTQQLIRAWSRCYKGSKTSWLSLHNLISLRFRCHCC